MNLMPHILVRRQPVITVILLLSLFAAQDSRHAWAQPQAPNNLEQLVIYQLNRARNNPAQFDQENNLAADLTAVAAQPPLAVNQSLVGAASFHAEEMATFNYFAHQSAVTGDWPNKMARDNGYVLPSFYPNTSNNIESIAAGTNIDTALEVLTLLIEDAGVVPPGHRIQLLAMDTFFQTHREIGVGHAFNAAANFRNYFAIHTAVSPGNNMFLTGVVFNDANGNGRYDLGEGVGGVTISNGVATTTTNAAGGWSMLTSAGTFTVSALGGAFVGIALANVTVTSNNVEVDFISGNPRAQVSFVQQASSTLVSAVLPGSRSVQVGAAATAFATIINAGASTATSCAISAITVIPATFSYQATDPLTNLPIGSPNTPVNIAAGGFQSFVISLTPSAVIASIDVQLSFSCSNASAAAINSGLNTLLFSASATPIPDIVALAATIGSDGIVNIPGTTGTGVFAVATVNVGASGSITASADTGGVSLPVNLFLCQTNPVTGACLGPLASSVTTTINANATPTFGIFVQGASNVSFNPATNRIFVRFKDGGNVTRGSTSVAVRTQ